jgi:hypothetical protein
MVNNVSEEPVSSIFRVENSVKKFAFKGDFPKAECIRIKVQH